MRYGTTCKFCKKPITIEIDDSYDVLGDPQKLIPLAACNHCADVRVKRRNLESALQRQCSAIQLLNSAGVKVPEKARKNLTYLAQQYAKMIADWNHTKDTAWDDAIVDALLQKPQDWGNIIARLWKMQGDWKQRQSSLIEA